MEALHEIPYLALIWYVGLLDSIPDLARALIAAGLLAALLAYSRRRVPQHDVQFSLSFWKVSLITLLAAPLVVGLLPETRVAVFVAELEPAARESTPLLWSALLGIWGAGALTGVLRLATGYVRDASALRALPVLPEDHALTGRLRHWQRRLNAPGRLSLALAGGGGPRNLAGVRRLVLPRGAERWPLPAADVLIIQALCRDLKHQGRWHLFAQIVACCYWPIPWVRAIDERLLRDLHAVVDNLAAACYQDDLGYQRALRQIDQRLGDPAPTTDPPRRYLRHLAAVFRPRPSLGWHGGILADDAARRSLVWSEPGDKLALLVGQSVLVALLVGGVTLKEHPPEIERDYSITLDPSWMDTAFRDPTRYDRPPPSRDAAKVETAAAD